MLLFRSFRKKKKAKILDDQERVGKQIYTDWANHYLERAGYKRLIGDLQIDITDGILLANVIEAVTNEKVQSIKTNPRNETQMLENLETCLGCLAAKGINTSGLLARDIRDGNLKAILGLFFALSRYKQQQKSLNQNSNHRSATSSAIMRGGTELAPSKLPAPAKSTRGVLNNSTHTNPSSNIARLNHNNKTYDKIRTQTTGGQTMLPRNSQGTMQSHHTSSTGHQPLPNGGVSNIPHPSAKTAKTTTASKGKGTTDKQSMSASQKGTANGKNSMLGRLFGGSNAKERTSSKERTSTTRAVSKERPSMQQRTTTRDTRPVRGARPSESSMSLGTVSSSTSGRSTSTTCSSRSAFSSTTEASTTSTATSNSSGSPRTGLKAMQRTLGKALNSARKGSPKSQRKEIGRLDTSKSPARTGRSISAGKTDDSRHKSEAESNEINRNREREEARRASSADNSPASGKRSASKIGGLTPKGGKAGMAAKGKAQNSSGIPQPTKGQSSLGVRSDVVRPAAKTSGKDHDKNGKGGGPTRGGLYGTYPGPVRQRSISPKPTKNNTSSQDKKQTSRAQENSHGHATKNTHATSSSHAHPTSSHNSNSISSQNTRTSISHNAHVTSSHSSHVTTHPQTTPGMAYAHMNGPTSHIAHVKNSSDLSLSNHSFSTDSSASTPGTMSSGNSYSSDSSVIHRPGQEEVMTTYDKDNKAVTTFGTPEQQRAARSISELRQNLDATLQNLRSVSPSPSIRSTVETTFDNDNVVTQQMHLHPNTVTPKETTIGNESVLTSGLRPPVSYLRNFVPPSAPTNSMQTSSMRSYGEGGPLSSSYGSRPTLNRFIPSTSSTRLYNTNSLRRSISNRTHLTEMNTDPTQIMDDVSDPVNEDIATGYVSDGDILTKNAQMEEITSGYMSEGGGLLYNKRFATRFRDGMAAVRECMSKTLTLTDTDSCEDEDSSSISSGISETIAEMSTDDNVTCSSISCSSSAPNTPSTGRRVTKPGQAFSDKSSINSPRNSVDSKLSDDMNDPDRGMDMPDGDVIGYEMKRSSSSSGNVWRKYSPTDESPDKSIEGKTKDKNANLPNDKWRRGDSDLSDSGHSGKSRRNGETSGKDGWRKTEKSGIPAPSSGKKESTSPKPQRAKSAGSNKQEDRKTSGKQQGSKSGQEMKKSQSAKNQLGNFGYKKPAGPTSAGSNNTTSPAATTPNSVKTMPSKVPNFGFGLKSLPNDKLTKSTNSVENSHPKEEPAKVRIPVCGTNSLTRATTPRSAAAIRNSCIQSGQHYQSQPLLSTQSDLYQHYQFQQQLQQQQLQQQQQQIQQLQQQAKCASNPHMLNSLSSRMLHSDAFSDSGNDVPSISVTGSSSLSVGPPVTRTSPCSSDIEVTPPTLRARDISSRLSSPSLKRLFSRGKGDGNRCPSPSAFSDTIISNPHATYAGHAHLLKSMGGRYVTSSETQTPSHLVPDHHHPMQGTYSNPNTNAELTFPNIMYNNTLNYQTYPKDPYRSHTSSMGSLYSAPGAVWTPSSSYLSNSISESGSIESMDSASSQLSLNSRATSERYGISTPKSGPGSPLIRTNSIRSTTSERIYPTSLALKDFDEDWMRSYSYGNLTPNGGALSPTHSTCSQPATRFNYPSLSPTSAPGMIRSNSMTSPGYGQGMNGGLRNSTISVDGQRTDDVHGSALSLFSSSSQYSVMTEEKATIEIRKLKKKLDDSKDKVYTLTNQLQTNAHVVSAFEQSLSNMTNRLQTLSSCADQKDSELRELRETIEALKKQSAESRQLMAGDPTLRRPFKERTISEPRMSRQLSTDSMSSTTSFTSLSSIGSVTDTEPCSDKSKKKKKSWLRTSFRSPFSRKKNSKSGAQTDVEDLDTSPTSPNYPLSPSMTTSAMLKSSASTSAIYDEALANSETLVALRKQLRDKEMKLTDTRLDALSSAHQLDQLKESMNKMKNEMMTLKQENERLQRQAHISKSLNTSSSQLSDVSTISSKRLSRDSLDHHRLSMTSDHGSLDILLDDSSGTTTNGRRVIVGVSVGHMDPSKAMGAKVQKVLIGTLSISSKTKWDALDNVVRRIFKEYVLRIDPVTNLGLNAESVFSYEVGEIHRTKDGEPPELLPCGYLVGESNSITIHLKNVLQGSCDALVFETLIPKSVMQRYISLLLEHRRIILCGPSGTGKTYLGQKLAEHIVLRAGKEPSEGSIATFNVDHKSCKELRQYLANIADQCESNANDLPSVIILDNLHHVGSLGEVFNGFLSCRYQVCPYIIGTMNQATCSTTNLQLHHNFRWVLCANHMEPVKGFLGRYLRRKLVETEVQTNSRNNDLNKIIEWMPKVWQHLNKFLETHNSSDVTIGPRLFLSCPIDLAGSQVWFTDLWNYSIVPYLLEAIREGLQMYGRKAQWEDPAEWVIDSYPWAPPAGSDWPSLLRLRPEDVGFDGYRAESGAKSTQSAQSDVEGDPLLSMLMHLQEAASYSSPHSCESNSS